MLQDVLEGYVSIKKAAQEYGVAITPQSFEIDKEGTVKLRDFMCRSIEKNNPEAKTSDYQAGVLVEERK